MDDGSVFMAGYTYGNFSSENLGSTDFLAIQLDADGLFLWSWQASDYFLHFCTPRQGTLDMTM